MSAEAPDRLDLIRIEIRKAERAVRSVKQLVAQEIDSRAAATNDSRGGTRERSGDST